MKVYTPPIMTLHRRTGWQFSEWSECHSDHNGNCIQSRFVQCMHSQERASMFFLKFQSRTFWDFRDFSLEIFKSRFRSPRFRDFRDFSFGIFSGFLGFCTRDFSGFLELFKSRSRSPGFWNFFGIFESRSPELRDFSIWPKIKNPIPQPSLSQIQRI